MALTANREVDHYVDQELRSYKMAAAKHVFKGSFVGLSATGYAQPLVAGNRSVGLAYEDIDNSAGAAGAMSVRVYTFGDFGHALTGATLADIGRAVFASDDGTITYDPSENSFVGYVQDVPASNQIILRLDTRGPANLAAITHHATNFTLTAVQSGTTHSNLGAGGTITATLPQSPPKGTVFYFVCMADLALQIDPGAAGGIYIKGAKQTDDKYASVTDIGDFIHVIADGNGDWVAVSSISGADADIAIEV